MKKQILFFAVTLLVFGLMAYLVNAASGTTTGQVTVSTTCVLSINTSSIGILFGSLGQSQTSPVNTTRITNSGNIAANLSVSGAAWSDGVTHTIPVSQTHWSSSWTNYDSANVLGTDLAEVNSALGASGTQNVWIAVRIPADQYAGTYTQTITLDLNC
ncbi:hypothetical protein HY991_04815 [Candidatus Micrarchaeota archaeon]|nr:hypothetical protein [Candidatus Micrarchaeota archaeon]